MATSRLRVLHVHNSLYHTHLLSRAMRELGHSADTLYFNYSERGGDLTWGCDFNLPSHPRAFPKQVGFFLYALAKYDVFHFWARPYLIPPFFTAFTRHVAVDLALLKRAGKTVAFHSDGCYAMIRPSVWKTAVDPQICHVCQTTQADAYGFCSNDHTVKLNAAMERHADLRFGMGMGLDFEAGAEFVHLPVDLTLWHPELTIPAEHVYERRRPGSVLVYHGVGSHVIGSRGNIKGTAWIRETVEQLQREGCNIELMHVEGCPNRVVRFYQAQADIVVDQLLIGGGGQNARECLALGKPVLTRIHAQQLETWRLAANNEVPPYLATDRQRLRADLIRLIDSPELRRAVGEQSAEFARAVLSPAACAQRLLTRYEAVRRARREQGGIAAGKQPADAGVA
jgi:glycosyltransferase involved in cell wall biosynthesis